MVSTQVAALEDAPAPLRARLEGLRCAHSYAYLADSGPEMAKVLEWNAQYGEVKKRTKAAQSSLYL